MFGNIGGTAALQCNRCHRRGFRSTRDLRRHRPGCARRRPNRDNDRQAPDRSRSRSRSPCRERLRSRSCSCDDMDSADDTGGAGGAEDEVPDGSGNGAGPEGESDRGMSDEAKDILTCDDSVSGLSAAAGEGGGAAPGEVEGAASGLGRVLDAELEKLGRVGDDTEPYWSDDDSSDGEGWTGGPPRSDAGEDEWFDDQGGAAGDHPAPGSTAPLLGNVHKSIFKKAGARPIDGGDPRITDAQLNSRFTPFPNFTMATLGVWACMFNVSRKILSSLFDVLNYTYSFADGDLHAFNPQDLPQSADHFVADLRKAWPLLTAYEYKVDGHKANGTATQVDVVSFAMNEILQRLFLKNGAALEAVHNQGGKRMSQTEAEANNVVGKHVFAVPTQTEGEETFSENMNGHRVRRSPAAGIETVRLHSGQHAHIGDTVIVGGEGPFRLASLYWQMGAPPPLLAGKEPPADNSTSNGALRVGVRRFRFSPNVKGRHAAFSPQGWRRVWEEVGDEVITPVDIASVEELCIVEQEGSEGAGGARPGPHAARFSGAGFVRPAPGSGPARCSKLDVVKTPWNRRGPEGLDVDMRAPGVHHNKSGLGIVKLPMWYFTDAANAFKTAEYSASASYMGIGNLSQACQRRLKWSFLTSIAGPGAVWQQEHLPVAQLFGALQKGCMAYTPDGEKVSGRLVEGGPGRCRMCPRSTCSGLSR